MSNKNFPLISVVMNCYNGEKYLREAIDSVYMQSHKNWEIIFWDNASSDSSEEIANSYDKRLKYFKSRKNTVLGEARVQAVKKANGNFIAFLDVDDIWLEKKLEQQLSIFLKKEGEIGFVYGRSEAIYSDSLKNNFIIGEGFTLPDGDIFLELAKENFVVFSSLMVDREKFYKCGGFPSHFLNSTDYWVLLNMAQKYPCGSVQELCCKYRIHDANLSKSQRVISAQESIEILNKILPNDSLLNLMQYQYANLAIMHIKEFNLLQFFVTIFKYKCFILVSRRLLRKIFTLKVQG
jgi:glycosyltransferase involved in cell wall biosynthesis